MSSLGSNIFKIFLEPPKFRALGKCLSVTGRVQFYHHENRTLLLINYKNWLQRTTSYLLHRLQKL